MTKKQNRDLAPDISGATLARSTRTVPSRVRELLEDQASGRPIWIRPPKQGVEFYCGLSRAKLYEGAAKGHFRSVSIREPGQVKGTRLFNLQSILDFIARCEAEAEYPSTKTQWALRQIAASDAASNCSD